MKRLTKSIYESILDDEDVLIANVKDTGLQGFGSLVNKTSGELISRFDEMRKDSKLKNLIFPDDEEIYKDVRSLIEKQLKDNKTIANSFSSHSLTYTIRRKDKKTAKELHENVPRDPRFKWMIDLPDEIKQVAKYFGKDYKTTLMYDNPLKIKCDVGNVVLRIQIDREWSDSSNPTFKIEWYFEYKPSSASKNKTINTNPVDFLGHPISDGDLAVGVQRGNSYLNLDVVKLAKSGNRVYVGKQLCALQDIIVIQHNGKSVDMSDVKLK